MCAHSDLKNDEIRNHILSIVISFMLHIIDQANQLSDA